MGKTGILYTRGSVPYYGTYPGARIPRPLNLRPHDCETPLASLASEVLALTKMNWNSTQFSQALPIPIRAARQVGRVLKHVSYGVASSQSTGSTCDRSSKRSGSSRQVMRRKRTSRTSPPSQRETETR